MDKVTTEQMLEAIEVFLRPIMSDCQCETCEKDRNMAKAIRSRLTDYDTEKARHAETLKVLVEVTEERDALAEARPGDDRVFIEHIRGHLKVGQEVVCKICGKTAREIIRDVKISLKEPK